MKDLYSTIRKMNKEPLQQHALKLLKQEKAEYWENELYLTTAALRVLEANQEMWELRKELEEGLSYQMFNKVMNLLEILSQKHPETQMKYLTSREITETDEYMEYLEEEITDCETLEELTGTLIWNAVSNLESMEIMEMHELDRTMSGYDD